MAAQRRRADTHAGRVYSDDDWRVIRAVQHTEQSNPYLTRGTIARMLFPEYRDPSRQLRRVFAGTRHISERQAESLHIRDEARQRWAVTVRMTTGNGEHVTMNLSVPFPVSENFVLTDPRDIDRFMANPSVAFAASQKLESMRMHYGIQQREFGNARITDPLDWSNVSIDSVFAPLKQFDPRRGIRAPLMVRGNIVI